MYAIMKNQPTDKQHFAIVMCSYMSQEIWINQGLNRIIMLNCKYSK